MRTVPMSRAVAASSVTAAITGWAPCSLSVPAAEFTRGVVAQARPATPARAKALLFAASRLSASGSRSGWSSTPRCCVRGVGDRAIHPGRVCSGLAGDAADAAHEPAGARSGDRALLGAFTSAARARAREAAVLAWGDREVVAARGRAGHPGARAASERAGVSSGWRRRDRGGAATRPRQRRRCARGRGPGPGRSHAGARRAGAFSAAPSDCWRPPPSPRSVHHQRPRPDRRNVTDSLYPVLSADSSLPSSRPPAALHLACRVRARIGLPAFIEAAGISCSQRLGDLAAQLPARDRARTGRAAREATARER